MIILTLSSAAQTSLPTYDLRVFSFGIVLGLNSSSFKVFRNGQFLQDDSIYVVEPAWGPGFNLGIISSMHLGEHVELRFVPQLAFADKNLEYTMWNNTIRSKQVESIYADFPIFFKLKSDKVKDFRVFVIGGAKYSFDFISNADARDGIDIVKTTKNDLSVEYGVGADFYLEYFKLGLQLKFSNGVTNVLAPSNDNLFTNVLDRLYSRSVQFSVLFE